MTKQITWRYHRKNCETCQKAQDYIDRHKVSVGETVDARKIRMGNEQAVHLARQVDHVYAAKGKKCVHLDMQKDKPSDEEIVALLIGPTGNLRAPTLKVGKSLLVGFEPESYDRVLLD